MAKTITALKQRKRHPNRVNVYLDGEFAFSLAKIVAAWLHVGQHLVPDKIQQLRSQDEVEAAVQRAHNFLSYRPRSRQEVEGNLRKHGIPEETIEQVIARLRDQRLLDDLAFARQWVENRSAFHPRGRYALRSELRQKGVAEAIIEQALEGVDEEELARLAAEKKARQLQGMDWKQFFRKLSGHLSRRGFGYEIVAEVSRQTWESLHPDKPQTDFSS